MIENHLYVINKDDFSDSSETFSVITVSIRTFQH